MSKIQVWVFAVLLAVFAVALVTSNDDASELPKRPGYCLIDGIYIKEGEEGPRPIGMCMRMTCENATVGFESYSGVGCGTFVPRRGCHLSDYDDTKRYPDCCPRSVCPENIQE